MRAESQSASDKRIDERPSWMRKAPSLLLVGALLAPVFAGCSNLPDGKQALQKEACRPVDVSVESKGQSFSASRPHIFAGPEDITIDQHSGIAYVSAYPRIEVQAAIRRGEQELPQGDIYEIRLADIDVERVLANPNEKIKVYNLTRGFSEHNDFHPHGIWLHQDQMPPSEMFVVNHAKQRNGAEWRDEDFVDRFRVSSGGFEHDGRFPLGGLCNANDIAALDEDRFLVTNTSRPCSQLGGLLDALPWRRTGSIILFDRGVMTRAISGFGYPNGITLSPSTATGTERQIYVALSLTGEVRRFGLQGFLDEALPSSADPADLQQAIVLEGLGLADNLQWGEDGQLYVGAHPSRLRFGLYGLCQMHMSWCSRLFPTSPSAAFRARPQNAVSHPVKSDLLYYDDGEQLSGSSVAAVYKNIMLIGSVFSDKLVVCNLAQ